MDSLALKIAFFHLKFTFLPLKWKFLLLEIEINCYMELLLLKWTMLSLKWTFPLLKLIFLPFWVDIFALRIDNFDLEMSILNGIQFCDSLLKLKKQKIQVRWPGFDLLWKNASLTRPLKSDLVTTVWAAAMLTWAGVLSQLQLNWTVVFVMTVCSWTGLRPFETAGQVNAP